MQPGGEVWSGRGDSNSRSLDPQSSAITRLRYVPTSAISSNGCLTPNACDAAGASASLRFAMPAALPRDAFTRAAGMDRDPRWGTAAARDGTRSVRSTLNSSRIDCRPRFTAVRRSRAFRPMSASMAGASAPPAPFLLEFASRAGERQPFDQQQMLDPQHLLDVGCAGTPAERPQPSRRRAPETPPPTTAARTAAPWRGRTPPPP